MHIVGRRSCRVYCCFPSSDLTSHVAKRLDIEDHQSCEPCRRYNLLIFPWEWSGIVPRICLKRGMVSVTKAVSCVSPQETVIWASKQTDPKIQLCHPSNPNHFMPLTWNHGLYVSSQAQPIIRLQPALASQTSRIIKSVLSLVTSLDHHLFCFQSLFRVHGRRWVEMAMWRDGVLFLNTLCFTCLTNTGISQSVSTTAAFHSTVECGTSFSQDWYVERMQVHVCLDACISGFLSNLSVCFSDEYHRCLCHRLDASADEHLEKLNDMLLQPCHAIWLRFCESNLSVLCCVIWMPLKHKQGSPNCLFDCWQESILISFEACAVVLLGLKTQSECWSPDLL